MQEATKLDYFNGGIEFHNYQTKGHPIDPDETYWKPILGQKLVRFSTTPETSNTDFPPFISCHWVDLELYGKIKAKMDEIGIDQKHLGNLAIPISDYRNSGKSFIGEDIRSTASEFGQLQRLIDTIRQSTTGLISLRMEIGQRLQIDDEDGHHSIEQKNELLKEAGEQVVKTFSKHGYIYSNKEVFNFKSQRAMDFLESWMRKLLSYQDFLDDLRASNYEQFEDFSLKKEIKKDKLIRIEWLYSYMKHKGIGNSFNHACRLAGDLLSLVGHTATNEGFHNQADRFQAYASYNAYLSDSILSNLKSLGIDIRSEKNNW